MGLASGVTGKRMIDPEHRRCGAWFGNLAYGLSERGESANINTKSEPAGEFRVMRVTLLVGLLAFLSSGALAQGAHIDRIEIVSKGIYKVQTGAVTKDSNMPAGEVKAPDSFKNVEATRAIPARFGVEFGFEYRVVGAPDGAEVALRFVNIYPATGLADPASAKPILSDKFERTKKIGEVNYLGYGFEHDWELVPGTWKMEIWSGGRRLIQESFTVIK